MRKILISILLASAAASPALAQDRGHDRGHRDQQQSDQSQTREERAQAHEARQQVREQVRDERSNGGANFERSQQGSAGRPVQQVEGHQQVQDAGRSGFDRSRFEHRNDGPRVVGAPQQVQEVNTGGQDRSRFERGSNGPRVVEAPNQPSGRRNRGDWNGERGQQTGESSGWTRTRNGWTRTGDLRQSDRAVPNVMRTRNPLVVSTTPREGTQPPLRAEHRRWSSGNWNTNWRRDGRYDWHNWRDRHRSRFHIGIYYDPFGWGYQPYQIGWRLWPSYYGRQYWIDDPYQYRLPYAPPGTTWVRYWDDALLVDTYTGEVIDVIHNFFW